MVNAKEKCFTINSLIIQDENDLFDIKHFEEQFETMCVGSSELTKLLHDITNILIENGYTTSRPHLKTTSLKSGKLEVEIHYSKIDKIVMQQNGKHSEHLKNSLNIKSGGVLNMHDIDESVDNIMRLPGSLATADIRPSTEIGYSDIILNEMYARKYGGGISFYKLCSFAKVSRRDSLHL